jgi:flagellar assembly protein FliH
LLSDRSQSQAPKSRLSRVIKSHEVESLRFAFPVVDTETFVPAGADDAWPPDPVPSPEPAAAPRPATAYQAPAQEAAPVRVANAHAEAHIEAMERRAALLLAEAEETAHDRVARAEAEVAAMLSMAEAEAEKVRTAAQQAGFEAGYADGHREGLARAEADAAALLAQAQTEAETELAEARAMAESIHQAAVQERADLLDTTWNQVLDLAFAMARQILKAEVALRPEAMLPMLGVALSRLKGEEEPQVRVAPELVALLDEHRGRLLAAVPGARRLDLEADHSLAPGDFIVQGSQGFIDGRLEQQVRAIESELKAGER